ncbi:FecR family protein [Alteromonas gracilis]|uniref:FecR family protein n=1 Tax=Alteromonas gracilis TaxID=1479524 RepID=UPI003736EDF5
MNNSTTETNATKADVKSNVIPLKSDEHVLDEASEWLVKLDNGLDESETKALKVWLATPLHRDTFLEMVALWDKMSVLNELADIVPHAPESSAHHSRSGAVTWKRPLAIAASFLMVGFLSYQGLNLFSSPDQTPPISQVASYSLQASTKAGEHKSISLEDGSTLWLNTNSQVNIAFTDTSRVIQLVKGELHIEVAKDKSRPLNVLAAGKAIQAVGTAFNVQYHRGDLELVVTEGVVEVASYTLNKANGKTIINPIITPQATPLTLVEGEKSLLSLPNSAIETVSREDITNDLSWREGKIVFRGESLIDVIEEVSRYTDKTVVLGDSALANMQVAGLFNTNDVDALIAALADNLQISTDYSNDTIVLRPR